MSELIHARGMHRLLAGVGLIVTTVVFGLPLLTLALASIAGTWTRALPAGIEEIAGSLGATPTRVLARVTLPLLLPQLRAAVAVSVWLLTCTFGALWLLDRRGSARDAAAMRRSSRS